jgi:hypothetical protein
MLLAQEPTPSSQFNLSKERQMVQLKHKKSQSSTWLIWQVAKGKQKLEQLAKD